MDMIGLLKEIGVDHLTEGHKHCRPGWVNMPCCWCTGNPGYHLGWNFEKEYFYCWRCGFHRTNDTVAKLAGVSWQEARSLMKRHGGRPKMIPKNIKRVPRALAFKFPAGAGKMEEMHRRYLRRRGFDPHELEKTWGLLGTGPTSFLDGVDYRFRVIAPIQWKGEVVSFQGRDITGRSKVKYRACSKQRELIHHKHILYGKQDAWEDVGICVEGITDVWRLGPLSFATFGINYSTSQVIVMAEYFKRIVVLFDSDPQAMKQREKLVAELRMAGVDARPGPKLSSDPGDLSQDEANELVRSLLK